MTGRVVVKGKRHSRSDVLPTFSYPTTISLVRCKETEEAVFRSKMYRMISVAGLSLISIGRVVRVAASIKRSLKCESILNEKKKMVNIEMRKGNWVKDGLQDRLEVVHSGVKQCLHHSEGEFGVLCTGGSFLGLICSSIVFAILDKGTAEQSTIGNSQKPKKNERRQQEYGKTSGASASCRISSMK